MYTAVMERTREIGILKSLGASKLYIVNVVLRETTSLALAGIVVGILISLAARAAIDHRSTLRVVITGYWILTTHDHRHGRGHSRGFVPAVRAAQKDPIEALAYE